MDSTVLPAPFHAPGGPGIPRGSTAEGSPAVPPTCLPSPLPGRTRALGEDSPGVRPAVMRGGWPSTDAGSRASVSAGAERTPPGLRTDALPNCPGTRPCDDGLPRDRAYRADPRPVAAAWCRQATSLRLRARRSQASIERPKSSLGGLQCSTLGKTGRFRSKYYGSRTSTVGRYRHGAPV